MVHRLCRTKRLELAVAAGGGDELLGQKRALDAVRLAIGIGGPGYNVFVSGLRTLEERGAILRLLKEQAAAMPTRVTGFMSTTSAVPRRLSQSISRPGRASS